MLSLIACVTHAILGAALEDVEVVKAAPGVCAWPNLTKMPDGSIVAVLHNQPSHGQQEGDVEAWATTDGLSWNRLGLITQHEPGTVRMNHAAGLAKNGDLVVLVSGWSDTTETDGMPYERYKEGMAFRAQILDPIVYRSSDGGRTWSAGQKLERDEDGYVLVPFGDIDVGAEGSLGTSAYYKRTWFLRSEDDGYTWRIAGKIGEKTNETNVKHLGDGVWLAAARHNGLKLLRSEDNGASWTETHPQLTEQKQHPGDLLVLEDGRLLLVHGDRREGQFSIGGKISTDGGKTWGESFVIAETEDYDAGYPASAQLDNGKVVTVYYTKTPGEEGYYMGSAVWDPKQID
jgi:hypothetical protein